MKLKRHVTPGEHYRYIRVTHLSDRHRTARATAKHILDQINGLYGRDDKNPRVR